MYKSDFLDILSLHSLPNRGVLSITNFYIIIPIFSEILIENIFCKAIQCKIITF